MAASNKLPKIAPPLRAIAFQPNDEILFTTLVSDPTEMPRKNNSAKTTILTSFSLSVMNFLLPLKNEPATIPATNKPITINEMSMVKIFTKEDV
jgi:hypothetical protein